MLTCGNVQYQRGHGALGIGPVYRAAILSNMALAYPKQRKCALNACAWPLGCSYVDDGLWCRIGYAQAFDPFAESPQAVKRAFRAAKLKPYDVTAAEILQMKQAAQSEYRQQVA